MHGECCCSNPKFSKAVIENYYGCVQTKSKIPSPPTRDQIRLVRKTTNNFKINMILCGFWEKIDEETPEELEKYENDDAGYSENDILDALEEIDQEEKRAIDLCAKEKEEFRKMYAEECKILMPYLKTQTRRNTSENSNVMEKDDNKQIPELQNESAVVNVPFSQYLSTTSLEIPERRQKNPSTFYYIAFITIITVCGIGYILYV